MNRLLYVMITIGCVLSMEAMDSVKVVINSMDVRGLLGQKDALQDFSAHAALLDANLQGSKLVHECNMPFQEHGAHVFALLQDEASPPSSNTLANKEVFSVGSYLKEKLPDLIDGCLYGGHHPHGIICCALDQVNQECSSIFKADRHVLCKLVAMQMYFFQGEDCHYMTATCKKKRGDNKRYIPTLNSWERIDLNEKANPKKDEYEVPLVLSLPFKVTEKKKKKSEPADDSAHSTYPKGNEQLQDRANAILQDSKGAYERVTVIDHTLWPEVLKLYKKKSTTADQINYKERRRKKTIVQTLCGKVINKGTQCLKGKKRKPTERIFERDSCKDNVS